MQQPGPLCGRLRRATQIVGEVENPCANDIAFETTSTCLVPSWEWVPPGGASAIRDAPVCGAAITTWKVSAGKSVDESQSPSVKLKAGTYKLSVNIGTTPARNISVGKIDLK